MTATLLPHDMDDDDYESTVAESVRGSHLVSKQRATVSQLAMVVTRTDLQKSPCLDRAVGVEKRGGRKEEKNRKAITLLLGEKERRSQIEVDR